MTTAVVSFSLFLLFFGNRFGQYLGQAVDGELSPLAIFSIVMYRIPDIMVLVLPVSYFLSILITYGRLYSDNEMVVLGSCGVSQVRLLLNTMVSAVIVAIVVGVLSLYVVPISSDRVEDIKEQQARRSLFELLHPRRLEQFSENDPRIYYFEQFSDNGQQINRVFVADVNADPEREGVARLITANSAREVINSPNGHRYLVLQDGHQYFGQAGESDYQVSHFRTSGNIINPSEEDTTYRKYFERASSLFLWNYGPENGERWYARAQSELQWRISLPILVLVLTLMALALSYTDPRRGRYAKIFPAFIPTIFYLGLLLVAKDSVREQKVSASVGLWWVHGIFLTIGVLLLVWNNGRPLGKWGFSSQRAGLSPSSDNSQSTPANPSDQEDKH